MPEKIGGLPAHPLIIHLPLVLGPLVGLLALLLLVPALRARLLVPTAGLSVLFAVAAIAAVSSGQTFAQNLGVGASVGTHADAAKTLRMLAIALAVGLVGFALVRKRAEGLPGTAAALGVAVLGVATVGFTIKTGHEGATLVWKERTEAAERLQEASDQDSEAKAGDARSGGSEPADEGMSPEEHEAMQGG